MTFFKANAYCRSLHTGLASIRNQTEKEIIAGLVLKRSWIGLNRQRFTHWSNGQQVKFTNWNESQSDLTDVIKRRCSLVSASTGKWFEAWCGETHQFVCEKVPHAHRVKLKLKFRSGADMNDPAVTRQITEQVLHVRQAVTREIVRCFSIHVCVSFLLVFTLTHQPFRPAPQKRTIIFDPSTTFMGTSCEYRFPNELACVRLELT